ncbi:hypothetical protein, partial [Clostridium sp. 3-3]|uniref:hypothetical protein n=1 Tax=Clostridium sp. 3-3 TaxID=2070757 RepID=UPI000D4D92DE
VVFNTLSSNRNDRIVLEDTLEGATALIDDVEIYPLQRMENGKVTAWIKNIPSKGMKVLCLSNERVESKP